MTVLDVGFAPPIPDMRFASGVSVEGSALSHPDRHRVEVVVPRPEPLWFRPVVARILELARLRPGWEGSDAPAPSPRSLMAILDVLRTTLPLSAEVPTLVPTVGGGVQAEWHRRGVDLEIEVDADGDAHVWMQTAGSGDFWEGDPTACRERVRDVILHLS